MDYHALARQHAITGDSNSNSKRRGKNSLVPTKRQPLVLRATSTIFQVGWVGLLWGAVAARHLASASAMQQQCGTWSLHGGGGGGGGGGVSAARLGGCCLLLTSLPALLELPRPALPCPQYVVGLIVGAFQGLVVLFYQWVVDPAEHGTW
jgi:hypothetical protein